MHLRVLTFSLSSIAAGYWGGGAGEQVLSLAIQITTVCENKQRKVYDDIIPRNIDLVSLS